MYRILSELKEQLNIPFSLPDDEHQLTTEFAGIYILYNVHPKKDQVVSFLNSINQSPN